jgi:hypothetical protein
MPWSGASRRLHPFCRRWIDEVLLPSDRSQIPAFLRHFATLLTCGDIFDDDAKNDIAVTGSLTSEELRTLVVSQNPFSSSDVSEFGVEQIARSSGTFEEVVKKYSVRVH